MSFPTLVSPSFSARCAGATQAQQSHTIHTTFKMRAVTIIPLLPEASDSPRRGASFHWQTSAAML
jgi:hypothetical protein